MSTVDKLKSEAASLTFHERRELFKWVAESQEFQEMRLEELRKEIAIGIEQADRGELFDGKEVFERLHEKIGKNYSRPSWSKGHPSPV